MTAAGVDRLGHWVRPGKALILAYHNVVPDGLAGLGDASLHLPESAFRRQLDLICRLCQPLPLTDVLAGTWVNTRGRLPVAVTFDDAYRGAIEVALPELTRRGIPVTIFIAPALLGGQTLWWDALAAHWVQQPLQELRSEILLDGHGRSEAAREIAAANNAGWQEMPELYRTASEADLARVVGRGECTVGSHTWSHTSLPSLGEGEVDQELARSRAWLLDRFHGAYVDAVSYPYGHWSPAVETIVRSCGYRWGLALTRGSVRGAGPTGRFRLPRMNVPTGLSERGMRIRMGWR
jgi:peptidoglycan/xylan/chitin deacetylase (PgdA/CDA1 family)